MPEGYVATDGMGKVGREQILFSYHKNSEAPHEINRQLIRKPREKKLVSYCA